MTKTNTTCQGRVFSSKTLQKCPRMSSKKGCRGHVVIVVVAVFVVDAGVGGGIGVGVGDGVHSSELANIMTFR